MESMKNFRSSGLFTALLLVYAQVPAVAQEKVPLKVAQKKPVAPLTRHLTLVSPAGGENWEKGTSVTVFWQSHGIPGQAALELFKDRERIALVSRDIPVEDGAYRWTLAGAGVVPGTGYQVRLTTLDDRQSYVSPFFSVSEPYSAATVRRYSQLVRPLSPRPLRRSEPVTLKITNPRYQTHWDLFENVPIQWESTGLSPDNEIIVVLHKVSTRGNIIIGKVKNSGEFIYQVPYPRVLFGHDLRLLLIPLSDLNAEARSDPFAIDQPRVDLIPNSPAVSFHMPRRRPRKWWEVLGDVFTGGIIWTVNEAAELRNLLVNGATLAVATQVVQKGSEILADVSVDCHILEDGFNVAYAFPRQTIPILKPDAPRSLAFRAATRPMGLKAGTYLLEVSIDPENRQHEDQRIRGNNRVRVELKIK
jgi:hypothetical protein